MGYTGSFSFALPPFHFKKYLYCNIFLGTPPEHELFALICIFPVCFPLCLPVTTQ